MATILDRLDAAGFQGTYVVEVFSDDGRFDADHPGSLWRLPAQEFVARFVRLFR